MMTGPIDMGLPPPSIRGLITSKAAFVLFLCRNSLAVRWVDRMKALVEISLDAHEQTGQAMRRLLRFTNDLLRSHRGIPAVADVLVIYLAATMLVDVPSMKHPHREGDVFGPDAFEDGAANHGLQLLAY